MNRRWWAGLLGLLVLPALARSPWPLGAAPTATEVAQLVDDALRIGRRERYEDFHSTSTPAEGGASLRVEQAELESGRLGPEEIFLLGDELFAHFFVPVDGLGGLLPRDRLQRVHLGATGGLDTFSCDGCHSVGGLDGAGSFAQNAMLLGDGDRASSALSRNPPHLLGAGMVQALARELSLGLQAQRQALIAEAQRSGQRRSAALEVQGISFGRLSVDPDGTVDSSAVEGVSPDLILRPFGWKGDQALLRRFVEEAARQHFGAQSLPLEVENLKAPDRDRVGEPRWDPDGDGVSREIEDASLTTTALYLAMLESPVVLPPADPQLLSRWGSGQRRFSELGCADCHRPELLLRERTWTEQPDSPGAQPSSIHLLKDGEHPRSTDRVMLFSDLRRHRMGPGLADDRDHGDIPADQWLTRPLWGLAETAPYLHDGRAPTIPAAILAHGGEASASREAFASLAPEQQADLHIFLLSLTRQNKLRFAR